MEFLDELPRSSFLDKQVRQYNSAFTLTTLLVEEAREEEADQ